MKVEKVLKNGVKVMSMGVQADFEEAQNIFNQNKHTKKIDVEQTYNERVPNDFVGTYKVKVERVLHYERFKGWIRIAKDHREREMRKERDELWKRHILHVNEYPYGQFAFDAELIRERYERESCECDICRFRMPTFEEWKNNKYKMNDNKRTIKLGKALTKAGFEQQIIDAYSQQVKTEKECYITISDLPQHIAGMSYYAAPNSWDGFNGTSCQDTRHSGDEVLKLTGSLYDDRLFIAMLHYSLDDLQDMKDRLKARCMMRYVEVEGKAMLLATHYYGDMETKDILHNGLGLLDEVRIYNVDVTDSMDCVSIINTINGVYTHKITEDVHVCDTINEKRYIDCPMCDHDAEIEVYIESLDKRAFVRCPLCKGSKKVEYHVYFDIDEYVEYKEETHYAPYAENYSHYGEYIKIYMDRETLEKVLGKEIRFGKYDDRTPEKWENPIAPENQEIPV
ncbi:hypothetical protein [Bacillus mojavensis]